MPQPIPAGTVGRDCRLTNIRALRFLGDARRCCCIQPHSPRSSSRSVRPAGATLRQRWITMVAALGSGPAFATIVSMKRDEEADSVLRLVDTVIADLGVRTGRYVGRRARDKNVDTFVIQDGEEGRLRLPRPDLSAPSSVVAMARAAQRYLSSKLGEPVPWCPGHQHALDLVVVDTGFDWVCPGGRWRCALGEYAEQAWPHFDSGRLPEILAGRLRRRRATGWRSIGITASRSGQVATIGVALVTPELVAALRDAAAPLSVEVHEERERVIRLSAPTSPGETGPAVVRRRPPTGRP
jgi:hypothetical protein